MNLFLNTGIQNSWRFTEKISVVLRVLYISVILIIFSFTSLSAQQNKKVIIEGNKNYENKKYEQAEKEYKKALQQNKNNNITSYNLGNTYYQQGKYEEAANQFQTLTHQPITRDTMAQVYHNLGNSLLKQKKFEESINAYKNGLKNNPNDEQTRYNLAYAQKMLKQQQQQQKNDKNKDKKEEKKKKKKEEKKNNDKNKNENKKDKQEQQQQNSISKEDAQRLLDALQNDEKNIQDKVKKGKAGVKVEIEKDW